IPTSIFLGIVLGVGLGFLLSIIFRKIKMNTVYQVILLLGVSFGMLALESIAKPYVMISSLLGIIVVAFLLNQRHKDTAKEIKEKYNQLWSGFEILLFVLVGCATNIHYAFSKEGGILFGILSIALIFRSLGVVLCILGTKFTWKEKLFIVFSYLPKATVQASIGAIALSEGLACGTLVLTAAVLSILLTAPLGALLIDLTYKKLLSKSNDLLKTD
ncbi:MAG TPA: cation:proton antiporter, partial [Candidatus Pelethenecus sp.]|nr:cation:proton antiporter [Candidatus Pelethenecus sp.]